MAKMRNFVVGSEKFNAVGNYISVTYVQECVTKSSNY